MFFLFLFLPSLFLSFSLLSLSLSSHLILSLTHARSLSVSLILALLTHAHTLSHSLFRRFFFTVSCRALRLDALFFANVVAFVAVVLPKLPFMNKKRILGINS